MPQPPKRRPNFTNCDHDQIEAMFMGLQLGHARHKIDSTQAHIEEEFFHDTSQMRVRAKRELQRISRHVEPGMKHALREAGIC
jgi:hypothetical protein